MFTIKREYDKIKLNISKDILVYNKKTKEKVELNDYSKDIIFNNNNKIKCIIKLEKVLINDDNYIPIWEIIQCIIDLN